MMISQKVANSTIAFDTEAPPRYHLKIPQSEEDDNFYIRQFQETFKA